MTCNQKSRHSVRQGPKVLLRKGGSSYYSSPVAVAIREFNSLPLNIRKSTSLHQFKCRYKASFYPRKIHIPVIHERSLEILFNKFRSNFTDLNADKFRHNLSPTKYCPYCPNVVEDYFHFFFSCPKYCLARTTFLDNLSPALTIDTRSFVLQKNLNVKTILFSSHLVKDSFDLDKFFNITCSFIDDSLRFK